MTNINPASDQAPQTGLPELPASIDYRLRARAIVRAFKRGSLYRSQICDAQPELLRVAKGAGEPLNVECPICSSMSLVDVRYLFGPRLGSSGRCVADLVELRQVVRSRKGIFTCYVIEVCTSCSWNYLKSSFPIRS